MPRQASTSLSRHLICVWNFFPFFGGSFYSDITISLVSISVWWYCETAAAILLAFNRCVDLISARWAEKIFGGWRTWLWLLVPTLYGAEHLLFAKTVIWSGVIGCWHFNPHVGYLEDVEHSVS